MIAVVLPRSHHNNYCSPSNATARCIYTESGPACLSIQKLNGLITKAIKSTSNYSFVKNKIF